MTTIGFYGAGKVGFTLGKYFAENGLAVAGYYNRTPDAARDAARFTGSRCFAEVEELCAASDIVFVTVADGAIAAVAERLRPFETDLCHCSGLLPAAVLGVRGRALHPLAAIDDRYRSYESMREVCFVVEGELPFLAALPNPVRVIAPEQKPLYHAAATFLSNHVAAVAHTGLRLLEECGLDAEFGRRALGTLLVGQSLRIADVGPVDALTGPAERGDTDTVARHLACLEKISCEDAALYRALTRRLLDIAQQKHPDRDYAALHTLLGGTT